MIITTVSQISVFWTTPLRRCPQCQGEPLRKNKTAWRHPASTAVPTSNESQRHAALDLVYERRRSIGDQGSDGRETGQAAWRFVARKCLMRGVVHAAGESLLSPFVSVLNLIACPRTPRRSLHADTLCCVAAAITSQLLSRVIAIRRSCLVSRSRDYCSRRRVRAGCCSRSSCLQLGLSELLSSMPFHCDPQ